MADQKKKAKRKKKEEEITFYHPDLFEVPDGEPPYLKGYKCKDCGKTWFPKFDPCPECLSEGFDVVKLSRTGVLYSNTTLHIVSADMRKYAPLGIAYVDLPDGIRVFSQLEGDPESYKIGETLEVTSGPVRDNKDGNPIISYKFTHMS